MSRSFASLLLLLGLRASIVGAQDLEAMGKRVDSLRLATDAARVALDAYRRTHPPTLHFADSARIADGQIVVYFNPEVAGRARAGVQEADRVLSELGSAQRKIPRLIFSIVPDTALTRYDRAATHKDMLDVRVHHLDHINEPNRNSTEPDAADVAGIILTEATRQLGTAIDQEFVKWMDAPLPLDPRLRGAMQWSLLRLDVVSSPSPFGKQCVLGDLHACRVFLGFDSVADPLHDWYDVAGRRRIVSSDHLGGQRAPGSPAQRCESGDDAACLSILQLMGVANRPPAQPYVRQSLIVYALNQGGTGSVERLVSSHGTVGDALAAAANRPVDSLLADWRSNIAGRGGSSNNLPFSIAIGSMVWIVVCTFLALRSSRWR